MTITYQVERFDDVVDDIKPLIKEHYLEICSHPDIYKLNPDWDTYRKLDELGMLRIFTARDGVDLAGYFLSFVQPHIHYSDTIYAVNDILYLAPEYRGSTVGYKLIKRAAEDLRDSCGVSVLVIHMKIKHPFRPLLEKLGFIQTEENWEIVL